MCRYVWTRCLLPPHTHTHTRVKRVRAGKMRRVCKRGDGAALRFAQESQAFARVGGRASNSSIHVRRTAVGRVRAPRYAHLARAFCVLFYCAACEILRARTWISRRPKYTNTPNVFLDMKTKRIMYRLNYFYTYICTWASLNSSLWLNNLKILQFIIALKV